MPELDAEEASTGSSAYSAGGGGVVLEHAFGSVLLIALLTGRPLAMLGDDVPIDEVAFQAKPHSAVDDLVVTGTVSGPSKVARKLAIAARRNPTITKSDGDFVKLLADFRREVEEGWEEVRAVGRRLAEGLMELQRTRRV